MNLKTPFLFIFQPSLVVNMNLSSGKYEPQKIEIVHFFQSSLELFVAF